MTQLANRFLGLFVSDVKVGACIAPSVCVKCTSYNQWKWTTDCRGRCTVKKLCTH